MHILLLFVQLLLLFVCILLFLYAVVFAIIILWHYPHFTFSCVLNIFSSSVTAIVLQLLCLFVCVCVRV